MVDGLILETTFLIDLERELHRSEQGPAQAFLEEHASEPLFITHTIVGELAAGVAVDGRRRWEAFVAPFRTLPCNADVCWEYGQLYRYLRTNGLLIGANDLWIAATAVAFGKPIVTRNDRHFHRVPRLGIMSYVVE